MSPKTIIFFGPSGSGKGTQASLLKEYLKQKDSKQEVIYVETGDRFRKFIESDTHTSALTKDTLAHGGLLPEFLPIWIWTGFFIDNIKGGEHLILDGLARRVPEAPVLDGALRFYNREKPDVILLDVSDAEAFSRLKKRGRHDDNDKEIKIRLDWYKTDVELAIAFFRENSYYNFHDINGEQTVSEIHKEIITKLNL
ncbi:MAG: nucleoside monophosphate kinase [bacterium]|nr:nucleoside monophosphate kinase [bacterium]